MKLAIRFFLVGFVAITAGMLGPTVAKAQNQRARAAVAPVAVVQQPVLSEYKGVRLGMAAQEARTKLGEPTLKGDDQDYYVFSDTETATIAYDRGHKVRTISVDYQNGVGAPDYRAVLGEDVQPRPDGSLYKVVRRESDGFWVSYSRTGSSSVLIVTVTIQKF